MKIKIKKFCGFTLIELLVTIVIVGILTSISMSVFNGYIEQARIASIIAIEKTIDNLMAADAAIGGHGPVAKWDLDEGTGTVSKDIINNSDMTLDNNGLWLSDTLGERGYSVDLTGPWPTNRTTANVSRTIGDNFSFAMRFKTPNDVSIYTGTALYMLFIYCDNSSFEYMRFSLDVSGDGKTGFSMMQNDSGSWSRLFSTPRIEPDQKWHHYAFSYSPEWLKVYLDGKLFHSEQNPAPLAACDSGNITRFQLGGRLPMYVDNFRVWRTPIDIGVQEY